MSRRHPASIRIKKVAAGGRIMSYVYILKSQKHGRYYVGSTNDLQDRLRRHNSEYNKSTRDGIPWNLVKSEMFETNQEAYKRELQIKSYKDGEAFKRLLK